MLAAARSSFDQDGFLIPITFLLLPTGDVAVMSPEALKIPFTEKGKDFFASLIRMFIQQRDVQAVIQIYETWEADGDEALAWKEVHGSLEDYPNKQESLLALLEIRQPLSQHFWRARISRQGSQKPVTGVFTRLLNTTSSGRFCGWFGYGSN